MVLTQTQKLLLILIIAALSFVAVSVVQENQANASHCFYFDSSGEQDNCTDAHQEGEIYKAEVIPAGCFGSEKSGPTPEDVDCDDTDTWPATATTGSSGTSATINRGNDCTITDSSGDEVKGFITSTEFDGAVDLGDGRYCVPKQQGGDLSSNPIFGLLRTIIRFMSALVGILSVLFILLGGFRYMTAGGNPEATKKAISMIRNVVVGLILYSLMTLIINFLIPGGLL